MRRSRAVSTSSELKRFVPLDRDDADRIVVAIPRDPDVFHHLPQQMRGSGSPSSSATSRLPKPVSRITEPDALLDAVADDRSVPAQRMLAQRRKDSLGCSGAHADHRLAFVGDVQRIDAEQIRRGAHRVR